MTKPVAPPFHYQEKNSALPVQNLPLDNGMAGVPVADSVTSGDIQLDNAVSPLITAPGTPNLHANLNNPLGSGSAVTPLRRKPQSTFTTPQISPKSALTYTSALAILTNSNCRESSQKSMRHIAISPSITGQENTLVNTNLNNSSPGSSSGVIPVRRSQKSTISPAIACPGNSPVSANSDNQAPLGLISISGIIPIALTSQPMIVSPKIYPRSASSEILPITPRPRFRVVSREVFPLQTKSRIRPNPQPTVVSSKIAPRVPLLESFLSNPVPNLP